MNEQSTMEAATLAPATAAAAEMEAAAPSLPQPALPDALVEWLRQAKAKWRIVVISAAVGVLAAWAVTLIQPHRYSASAIAAVSPAVEGLAADDLIRGVDILERRTLIGTIAALASAPMVRTTVTHGQATDDYRIEAIVLPNTNLLRIVVEGGSAEGVAEVANRIPGVLSQQARSMYGVYRVTTISEATAPTDALYPRLGRTLAAGLVAGLIVGLLLARGTIRWPLPVRR